MEDLIKALQIFLKYGNPECPIVCENEQFHVVGIDPYVVSYEDILELKELGFNVDDKNSCFTSVKFISHEDIGASLWDE